MPDQKPFPSDDDRKNPPPPKPHDIPPHLFKELLHMSEKIGKLEGMVEVLTKQNHCRCEHTQTK